MSRRAGERSAADGEPAAALPVAQDDDADEVALSASGAAADPDRAAIAAALANEGMTLVQRIRAVEAIRPPPRPRPGPADARRMPPPPEGAWWETALWGTHLVAFLNARELRSRKHHHMLTHGPG